MASSSAEAAVKTSYHTRSVSLPSRRSHSDQTSNLEEQLCRLRSSVTASTSSSSSLILCQNLGLLNDLYESFDEFLQLQPHADQKALSHHHQCPHVEKALDGSIKLLDICSMSKDALLILKETLQKCESSLRIRRKSSTGESSPSSSAVQNFMVSRKNIKRIVSRCSKHLSKMESCKIKTNNEIQGSSSAIMADIEEVSIVVFRSILFSVFGNMTEEKKTFFSKIIPSSKQTGKQGEVVIIMEKIDRAIESLKGNKNTEKIDFHAMESVIQELEEALDCLFRRLLRSRVSLLNILNN